MSRGPSPTVLPMTRRGAAGGLLLAAAGALLRVMGALWWVVAPGCRPDPVWTRRVLTGCGTPPTSGPLLGAGSTEAAGEAEGIAQTGCTYCVGPDTGDVCLAISTVATAA